MLYIWHHANRVQQCEISKCDDEKEARKHLRYPDTWSNEIYVYIYNNNNNTQKVTIVSPPSATHPQLWAELYIHVHVSIQECTLSHLHLHPQVHVHASTHTLHAADNRYSTCITNTIQLTYPELTIPLPLNPSGTPGLRLKLIRACVIAIQFLFCFLTSHTFTINSLTNLSKDLKFCSQGSLPNT